MAVNPYLVFYPYSGNALVSETTTAFKTPAQVDPFPASGTPLTATSFFPVQQWSEDILQTLNIGSQSSGAGAGKVTFNPFSITRNIDAISPQLFAQACSGTAFKFVDLLLLKASGSTLAQTPFLAYRFGLVAIETVKWSEVTGVLSEVVTFEYGQLTIGYAQQNPDGTYKPMTFKGWDRVKNVAI
ncbi:type VI secretion system tube protein Hcp [uncultured Jatrophihabitans sp.]|uniref:type VI secretion system tube protein Hcp n=1 Tax=uncultured Jatrophihabitans sp. TaxID=1610747 RepID=UPI0035CC4F01